MVSSVANLTRSGLGDFIIQRISAVILGTYSGFLLGFIIANPGLTYAEWLAWHDTPVMLIVSTLMVLATAAHGWIGMWTVGTDYIREHYFGRHNTLWRGIYLLLCLGILFVYVLWALSIFLEALDDGYATNHDL